jgi:hypothetical protein
MAVDANHHRLWFDMLATRTHLSSLPWQKRKSKPGAPTVAEYPIAHAA